MKADWTSRLLAAYLSLVLVATLTPMSAPRGTVNLRPLATMTDDLARGGEGLVVNFLGNVALLAPLGFLLTRLRPSWATLARVAGVGAGFSLAIEVMQFAFGRRVADVDDVLLNTLGAALGYLAFRAIGRPADVASPPALSSVQREATTPTRSHIDASKHVEQAGRAAVQTDLPNGTSRSLISTQ